MMTNYDTFLGLLDLLAECCMGRNLTEYEQIHKYFENKILKSIFEDKNMNMETRSRCLKLFLAVYMDRKLFEPLVVPSETVIWKDLPRFAIRGQKIIDSIESGDFIYAIKMSKQRVPSLLLGQKKSCEHFLK